MITITAIALYCTIHISVWQNSQNDDINPVQEIAQYSQEILGGKCKEVRYAVEYISIE